MNDNDKLTILIHPFHVDYNCPCIYKIMHNYNSGMYHEPRHELDYTGNAAIVELNSMFNSTMERVHNARHKNVTSAVNTTFFKTSGL